MLKAIIALSIILASNFSIADSSTVTYSAPGVVDQAKSVDNQSLVQVIDRENKRFLKVVTFDGQGGRCDFEGETALFESNVLLAGQFITNTDGSVRDICLLEAKVAKESISVKEVTPNACVELCSENSIGNLNVEEAKRLRSY